METCSPPRGAPVPDFGIAAKLHVFSRLDIPPSFKTNSFIIHNIIYISLALLRSSTILALHHQQRILHLTHQHTLPDPSKAQEEGFLETTAWQKCSCTAHPSPPTRRSCPTWKQQETSGDTRCYQWWGGTRVGTRQTLPVHKLCQTNSVLVTSAIPVGCHGPSPSCLQSSRGRGTAPVPVLMSYLFAFTTIKHALVLF